MHLLLFLMSSQLLLLLLVVMMGLGTAMLLLGVSICCLHLFPINSLSELFCRMLTLFSPSLAHRSSMMIIVRGSMISKPFIIMITLCILNWILMNFRSMILLIEGILFAHMLLRFIALMTFHLLMHGYRAMLLRKMMGRPMIFGSMMILAKILRSSLVCGMLLSNGMTREERVFPV